jgi:hypothetical protein
MSKEISVQQARELALEILNNYEKVREKFAKDEAKEMEELTIFEAVNNLNLYIHNHEEIPVEKLYRENEIIHVLFDNLRTMFDNSDQKIVLDTKIIPKYSGDYAVITRFYAKKK